MEAVIRKQTKNTIAVSWSDDRVGFGELTMEWDDEKNHYILDSELMGIDFIIKIFKALEMNPQ